MPSAARRWKQADFRQPGERAAGPMTAAAGRHGLVATAAFAFNLSAFQAGWWRSCMSEFMARPIGASSSAPAHRMDRWSLARRPTFDPLHGRPDSAIGWRPRPVPAGYYTTSPAWRRHGLNERWPHNWRTSTRRPIQRVRSPRLDWSDAMAEPTHPKLSLPHPVSDFTLTPDRRRGRLRRRGGGGKHAHAQPHAYLAADGDADAMSGCLRASARRWRGRRSSWRHASLARAALEHRGGLVALTSVVGALASPPTTDRAPAEQPTPANVPCG
jgi:hypothetical protein